MSVALQTPLWHEPLSVTELTLPNAPTGLPEAPHARKTATKRGRLSNSVFVRFAKLTIHVTRIAGPPATAEAATAGALALPDR